MNTSLKSFDLLRACAAAAIIALAPGCGSESTPTMMTPMPPAPQPQTEVVQLGSFGGSVTLTQASGGGWTLNNQPISSNTEVEGDNGLTYRLTLTGGMWMAEFVAPDPLAVNLGLSGEQVSLQLQEDGSYLLGEMAVAHGDRVADSGGSQYVLSLTSAGTWRATFLPTTVTVQLGGSGRTETLTSTSAGTWVDGDGMPIDSGDTIERGGNTYALRRDGSSWSATLVSVGAPGGGLIIGGPAPPPGSGPGSPSEPEPPRYVHETVTFDLPRAGHLFEGTTIVDLLHTPTIQGNVPDVGFNHNEVDVSRYQNGGRMQMLSYPEAVLERIELVLGPIDAGFAPEGSDTRLDLVNSHVTVILERADLLFGEREYSPDIGVAADVEEDVTVLRDLKAALSDVDAFSNFFSAELATAQAADPNVTAEAIFGLTSSLVAIGATDNTRFAVARRAIRFGTDTPTAPQLIATPNHQSAVYAYSPLPLTGAAEIPSTGTATYSGETWAVGTSSYVAWSGGFEMQVDFAASTASATISGLVDSQGRYIGFGTNNIDEIVLPLSISGANIAHTGSGIATLSFRESGAADTTDGGWRLSGRFVGAGDDAAVGVMGTWRASVNVIGAFGAERAP